MPLSFINIFFSFVVALVLHELGHFIAARACRIPVTEAGFGWGPQLYSVRLRGIEYQLRLLPLGAYIRLDMADLQKRALIQQLFVLLAGIAVNLIIAALAWGTFFGSFNLALALANLLPLYQQDGWKGGILICRRLFRRPNQLVEWSFTISGGLMSLAFLARALFNF
ncbi:MAG TPA: site-2 protease family protein [Pyrinomonadaceae bacterium]|jgi:regulator of sigma E protease